MVELEPGAGNDVGAQRRRHINVHELAQTMISFIVSLFSYWQCNFPMSPHVRLLVGWSVDRVFVWSICHNYMYINLYIIYVYINYVYIIYKAKKGIAEGRTV